MFRFKMDINKDQGDEWMICRPMNDDWSRQKNSSTPKDECKDVCLQLGYQLLSNNSSHGEMRMADAVNKKRMPEKVVQ